MNGLMKIHIFDVEHGSCNVIQTPNGKLIMIDCGHNATTGWRPSNWIVNNRLSITNLTIANIDEDHVSDLVNIDQNCKPDTLKTNWNLDADWIERKKRESGGVGSGVKKLLDYKRNVFTGDSITIDYGLTRERFCLGTNDFDDFNNLSIVTFIQYAGVGIVFPGDLLKDGWEVFLKKPSFIDWLGKVNIFLASHHGRENGYCEEVFDYCTPDIVIISDKAIKHETQMHDEYSSHTSGIWFEQQKRKVLTTRKDNKITIDVKSNGTYTVYTQG